MQNKLTLVVKQQKFDENGNIIYDDIYSPKVETSSSSSSSGSGSESQAASKEKSYNLQVAGILKGGKDYNTYDSIFIDLKFLNEIEEQYNKINNIKPNKKTENSQPDLGYNRIKIKVDSMDSVAEVDEAIKALGYETYSFEEIRKPMQEQARKSQLIFGSLGAISLLVAAFGIANTMIMSVYERTKEIGVMKVLGCPVNNIKTLFLMEAGGIGLMGGIVGALLSYLVSYIMNNISSLGDIGNIINGGYMPQMDGAAISIIPPWLLALGLIFSLLIGLISGIIPAHRAVKISALSAIKQEN